MTDALMSRLVWFPITAITRDHPILIPVAEPAASAAASTTTAPATTTAARTPATASAIEAATSAALSLRPGLIHINVARPQLSAVGARDCLLGLLIVGHFHKGETARLARIAVAHNGDVVHLPVSFESCPQVLFSDVVIEVPDVDVFH